MGELVETYLKEYVAKVKKSDRDDTRLPNKYMVTDYSKLPADQFNDAVVCKILAPLSDKPREYTKLRASIMTMFNVAVGKTKKIIFEETWLPQSLPNPVANVPVIKHTAVKHVVTKNEHNLQAKQTKVICNDSVITTEKVRNLMGKRAAKQVPLIIRVLTRLWIDLGRKPSKTSVSQATANTDYPASEYILFVQDGLRWCGVNKIETTTVRMAIMRLRKDNRHLSISANLVAYK